MTFERFSENDGREKFAKCKEKAKKEVDDGRLHIIGEKVHEQMMKEMSEKVKAEVKKIIPDNAPDKEKARLMKEYLDKLKGNGNL